MKHRYYGPRNPHADIPTAPLNGQPGCNGKRQYRSFRTAEKIAESLRKNLDGEHAMPYRCRHCQSFHIGGNGYEKRRKP